MKYRRFTALIAEWTGRPVTLVVATAMIVAWLGAGPYFAWSDTWQLYANTITTLITFLMVFVIQTTQNRATKILHIKLNELIRANTLAHNAMMSMEEKELEDWEAMYEKLSKE